MPKCSKLFTRKDVLGIVMLMLFLELFFDVLRVATVKRSYLHDAWLSLTGQIERVPAECR